MAVDLTASVLTRAYYLAKDMYAQDARKADFVADVDSAKALIENSVSNDKIKYLEDAEKEHTAAVYWSKFCNTTTGTTVPDYCSFTGAEADSAKKNYEITLQVNGGFSIDEANYVNNQLNVPEVFAENMLKTKKNLDNKIAQMLLAKLATFTSSNLYQFAGEIGCSDETGEFATTFIAPMYWTPKVYAYFLKVAAQNKFASPFLIDGENLFNIIFDAQLNAGNSNGSGAAAAVKLMKTYNDLKNMTAIAPSKTYMVERGTIAFANKSLWKKATATNPIKRGDHIGWKYSEKSENLPGVIYDVYTKTSCSGAYEKVDVLVDTRFDLFNGTEGCDGQTGVIEFECGACPSIEEGSGS